MRRVANSTVLPVKHSFGVLRTCKTPLGDDQLFEVSSPGSLRMLAFVSTDAGA
jgi:hypothetical protein